MPIFYMECIFEVYCATCGAGLCKQSEATMTRNRGHQCLRVDVCDVCIGRKDADIAELKEDIRNLEKTIEELENN